MGGSREWGKRLRRARPQARAVIEWNDKVAPVQLNEEAAPVQPVQKGKDNMKSITTGDIMHAMGSFGLQMDYTVRMKLRLTDEVDGAILAEAVAKTQRRYPYLSLRMCRNEQEFYYE